MGTPWLYDQTAGSIVPARSRWSEYRASGRRRLWLVQWYIRNAQSRSLVVPVIWCSRTPSSAAGMFDTVFRSVLHEA